MKVGCSLFIDGAGLLPAVQFNSRGHIRRAMKSDPHQQKYDKIMDCIMGKSTNRQRPTEMLFTLKDSSSPP